LERRGIPTVTVCSDAFISLAKAIATGQGAPDLRMVVVPHPIAGLPPNKVRNKAESIVDLVVQHLTGS